MGLSNRHWSPPLTPEDFEFENNRLVKIRGMRPAYLDGYALIAALEYMTELYRYKSAQVDQLEQRYLKLANLTPLPVPTLISMPTNVTEAEAMQKLGMAWLASNAPDRLTPEARETYKAGGVIYVGALSPDADPGGDSSGS